MNDGPVLLDCDLSVRFGQGREVLTHACFSILKGEILGLVGQSGAGKSTVSLAILGSLASKGASVAGTVRFEGQDLLRLGERQLRTIRGRRIALVPQSPLSSLNPALSIGSHFKEARKAHSKYSFRSAEQVVLDLLSAVNLPSKESFLHCSPRELSVGMAQRVLIALAAIHQPDLIIADEPTSSLDLVTQADILALFRRLNQERGPAILFISHDLLSVGAVCHRLAILDEGRIVETGATEQVFQAPAHPYTKRLLACMPAFASAFISA